jgi:hypothetical protein
MAGENKCFALVRGRAMRVTRLDGCGNPVPGAQGQVTTEGFIQVALTAQTDEGTTISVTNAAGKICVLDEPCPTFTGYDIEVQFCGVDPALYSLMTGNDPVLDGDGDAVGFRMNSGIDACESGFALEMWSNVPTSVCEPGQGVNYGYMLVPFSKGGIIGDFTIGNDAVNYTLTGAKSKDGSSWGVGPYDVVADGATAGPLLEAIDPKDHLHMQLTTVPPPEAVCGWSALGTPATGATAGSPGSFTPANSYGPANLAGMTGITASPTTAWTAGQSVKTSTGTDVHWSGTAWVSGKA